MKSLFSGAENSFNTGGFGHSMDRTFLEKIFGKEEMQELKVLLEKEYMSSSDVRSLSYLINGWEKKLENYSDNTRYLCGAYTFWINKVMNINVAVTKMLEETKKDNSLEGIMALEQAKMLADSYVREMTNVYLFFTRTSLSLGGMAFDAATKQRIEQEYTGRLQQLGEKASTTLNLKGGSKI